MAPEAITDPSSVDARTDLYCLGAVAYYLLAGENAFEGRSVVEICSKHLHERPPPVSRPGIDVSPELERIVLSCMEKDPALRPASAKELRHHLQHCGVREWSGEEAQTWWLANGESLHPSTSEAPNAPATNRTITRAWLHG
jgi:serine/threonine-protein kinase